VARPAAYRRRDKKAIAICNENRRLLSEMAALRREIPLVSGLEALQITGASMYLPREEHSALLRQFLQEAKERPALGGAPLFVTGSLQDHPYFYELVESCGAVIVAEDHDWGNRHFEGAIDPEADWRDALIDR
jgi:benzoyl-CoA reductase subunit C